MVGKRIERTNESGLTMDEICVFHDTMRSILSSVPVLDDEVIAHKVTLSSEVAEARQLFHNADEPRATLR